MNFVLEVLLSILMKMEAEVSDPENLIANVFIIVIILLLPLQRLPMLLGVVVVMVVIVVI